MACSECGDDSILLPMMGRFSGDDLYMQKSCSDLWSITSIPVFIARVKAMKWLSAYKAGRWLTYLVMHNFISIAVVKYWFYKEGSFNAVKIRAYRFFYGEGRSNVRVIHKNKKRLN